MRQSTLDRVPSLALGTSPVTLKEMVTAYGTIANGGGYIEPLLVTVLEAGRLVYEMPTLEAMRENCRADLARLDLGVKRLLNPHIYHVSLTPRLWQMKQDLIASVKAHP